TDDPEGPNESTQALMNKYITTTLWLVNSRSSLLLPLPRLGTAHVLATITGPDTPACSPHASPASAIRRSKPARGPNDHPAAFLSHALCRSLLPADSAAPAAQSQL